MTTRLSIRVAGRRWGLMLAASVAAVAFPWTARADDTASPPSDSDLMFEALKQWRVESPADAAAVDRLLVAAKKESRARRHSGRLSTFFRDPFADDPAALIPVRAQDRALVGMAVENIHPDGGATAGADDDLEARAQAALAEAEAARKEAATALADAAAARRDAERARSSCSASAPSAGATLASDDDGDAAENAPENAAESRAARHARRHAQRRQLARMEGGALDPRPELTDSTGSDEPEPKQWVSSDSHGILIVPITSSIPHKSGDRQGEPDPSTPAPVRAGD